MDTVRQVLGVLFLVGAICASGMSEYGVNTLVAEGDASTIPSPSKARAFDTTITKGAYTLTLSSSGTVASLQVSQAEFDNWNNPDSGFNHDAHRDSLSKVLYSFFKDEFDFIFFINNNDAKPSTLGYYGQLIQMKNDVDGLGMSHFDYTADAGSAGALQAVIHLPYLGAIKSGPTLHELVHKWANFMQSFEMASPGGNYPSIPHWGWASTEGQLGGFKLSTLQDLGAGLYQAQSGVPGSTSFGGFANGGNSLPYGPWEMYLAGFWPLDSCQDIVYFEGVTTDATLYGEGKFYATSQLTYTKSAMLSAHGARVPDHTTSQKTFRILPVVLTVAPLTTSQDSSAQAQVGWFTYPGADASSLYNFWEATRGVATISSDNLHRSLLGDVTPVERMAAKGGVTLAVSKGGAALYFSQPVQGYRVRKANGAIVAQQRGDNLSSVTLENKSPGIYLVSLLQDGVWCPAQSVILR